MAKMDVLGKKNLAGNWRCSSRLHFYERFEIEEGSAAAINSKSRKKELMDNAPVDMTKVK
ncbi:hypothetical protein [Paraliobacillus ryukyuensis]|uniref:hypothetical protein n=1 Tax=Paraliobacillus ryukyuensis TaxID=200904 RepID=UPI0009A904EC|nr:hypothetical protein [Paraliobacillus ryukyuensis]